MKLSLHFTFLILSHIYYLSFAQFIPVYVGLAPVILYSCNGDVLTLLNVATGLLTVTTNNRPGFAPADRSFDNAYASLTSSMARGIQATELATTSIELRVLEHPPQLWHSSRLSTSVKLATINLVASRFLIATRP